MADSGLKERRWTCKLCSQTRNTIDRDKCMTCARPRDHEPVKYRERLKEIRRWTDHSEFDSNEEFSWSDSWGLILGLIMIAVIIGLLIWAYLEDQKEQLRDETEF
eukprot:gnl/TRDRNA2_/TRDRNA2_191305_c0_seq1.p1 gnl/TRDRNA2_/TRDRNA2_191305_c0~~gnl/TRDRNA2_/TRDRNA2_191305_c0_seq1.p1  ORF type:complete len:105 (-),score=10.41 gnl/TRDRNA2_/TRDRNA2_191305_c0_seq1:67-381(-)